MTRDELAYREAHREEINARQRVWDELRREERNAQKRRYYIRNREEIALRRAAARYNATEKGGK